jgi:transposase InsO family protein
MLGFLIRVLLVAQSRLKHARRSLVSVTPNPTAEWIARQVTDAFPWDEAPRLLIRDRDGTFGPAYLRRIRAMGIRDHPTAARSPWQNGYAERVIGSIRRECLDHTIVFGEVHLRRILKSYADYYNRLRTHLSLEKDAPLFRRPRSVYFRGAAQYSGDFNSGRTTSSVRSGLGFTRHS